MIGRFVYLLTFLISISVVANSEPSPYNNRYGPCNKNPHNLCAGWHQLGDALVLRQNVTKASKWMQIVTLRKSFSINKNWKITVVEAFDQNTKGNGAYAQLESGGPGRNNVTICFKSQRGHSINFMVDIYAKH